MAIATVPRQQIEIELPDWAEPVMRPGRRKSLAGGRGPGKSHVFSEAAVALMDGLNPHYPVRPYRIASARDYQVRIKESVKTLVEHYIKKWGIEDRFEIQAYEINNVVTGSHMFFPGVSRDPDSFRSIEGVDIFWMEQAEVLQNEMNVVGPSIRKLLAEQWFSWNPLNRTDWCWKEFKLNPEHDDLCLWLDYRYNPWWDETGLERQRLRDQELYPELYPWTWMGEPFDANADMAVLAYTLVKTCVDAFEAGLAPDDYRDQITHGGLDFAEGGMDKCALTIRCGPVVEFVHEWPGVLGDLSVAATTAFDLARPYRPSRLYYDASSPGRTDLRRAGFRGVIPVNFGGAVQGPLEEYEYNRMNKDVFEARNMQMAEILRLRAINTYRRFVRNDKTVRIKDCLFINPAGVRNLESFMAQLTQPHRRITKTGKWALEKAPKDPLTGKEMDSPDRFDSTALAFAFDTDDRGVRAD